MDVREVSGAATRLKFRMNRIKISKAQKALEHFAVRRCRPLQDCFDLVWVCLHLASLEYIPQEGDRRGMKLTLQLSQIDGSPIAAGAPCGHAHGVPQGC